MYLRTDLDRISKDGEFWHVCDSADAQYDEHCLTIREIADKEYRRMAEEEKRRRDEAARLAHDEWLESQEEYSAGG